MIAISDNVQVRKDVPSGTIIINRPDRCNALSREIVDQIQQAFDDFQQEKSVRAVILTGSGPTFCSGSDLHQLQETAREKNAMELWHQDAIRLKELIETMLRFPKPIIAAVNGWAIGTGAALLLASDIVVASETANMLMPEALRGLSSGMVAPLLNFRIGAGRGSNILLSGQPVEAPLAYEYSLFHELVDENLVWARCQQIAGQCAAGARESIQMTKQMMNETVGENLFTQLSIGAANMAAARTTPAAEEGIAAFIEKRAPKWD